MPNNNTPKMNSLINNNCISYELVEISWATRNEMKRSLRYPEIKIMDTTSKTNRHNRLLVYICSVDSENKNVCSLTVLLYDKTRVSFDFTIKSLAWLHGTDYLQATVLFLSDGDDQIINSIKEHIELGVLNKKTRHRLC